MNFVFIVSILLKGIGAVLEIVLQVIITKQIGVGDFGTYSAFVNAADLIYWCLFSGLVKCNTFYLAEEDTVIKKFKRNYYFYYAFPVTLSGVFIALLLKRYIVCVVFMISLAELFVMDQSSTFMARKYSKRALFGEYVLGRFLLLFGIVILFRFSVGGIFMLVLLYLFQFLLIGLFFGLQAISFPKRSQEKTVSLSKWFSYQRADIIQSMIAQMPIVLQYFFVGSYEAGVVSVVMLVKKLVNFISGPSFKVFLPEFSRLYKQGNKEKIQECFSAIIRMQMLFLAPMSVVLIGFPKLLLRVMADELIDYTNLFILCSIIFIVVASLGPCSGLMQMTGNEKWDNRFREIALLCMFVVFVVMRKNPFFVLYGLCIQAVVENAGKLWFISRWMGALPMKINRYFSMWILPGTMIFIANVCGISQSWLFMFAMSGFTFACRMYTEIKKEHLLETIRRR